MNFCERTRV